MITDTIQNALKRLFCSIGGNADNVRNKDDINAILDEMTALNIGEKISGSSGGGGGGGVLVVHRSMIGTPPALTLDKTWQEIFDAASTGAVLIVEVDEASVEPKLVAAVYVDSGVYYCEDSSELVFSTDSADGYPVIAV